MVIALVPLKCSSRNLQYPHELSFTKEQMPWCPCPLKKRSIQDCMLGDLQTVFFHSSARAQTYMRNTEHAMCALRTAKKTPLCLLPSASQKSPIDLLFQVFTSLCLSLIGIILLQYDLLLRLLEPVQGTAQTATRASVITGDIVAIHHLLGAQVIQGARLEGMLSLQALYNSEGPVGLHDQEKESSVTLPFKSTVQLDCFF